MNQKSLVRLSNCHPDLQKLVKELAKELDLIVLCGHRDQVAQEEAFAAKTSKARWPKSKHNSMPSMAVDVALAPLDWNNLEGFKALGVKMKEKALELSINIKWGGDFKSFKDYPHFELDVK